MSELNGNLIKGQKIIRVFPRKTRATPNDQLVRINEPPGFFDEADEVHISTTFTWDRPRAEKIKKQWEKVAPVYHGGPAWGEKQDNFIPGVYLKKGYVITSRGCPNHCWFCSVWKRDGNIKELPITEGWNVLDDNLLACSEKHIRKVFLMLWRQPEAIDFSGGWEAKRLKEWHIDLLLHTNFRQVWFAYDEPEDLEALIEAGKLLHKAGFITKTGHVNHKLRCYCLVGYPGDTQERADVRLRQVYTAGFLPMAMLYRNEKNETSYEWRRFQRVWARPASINAKCRMNAQECFHL